MAEDLSSAPATVDVGAVAASPAAIEGTGQHTGSHQRRGRALGLVALAIVIAAPWPWFVVRDVGGRLDFVAVILPPLGATAVVVAAAIACC